MEDTKLRSDSRRPVSHSRTVIVSTIAAALTIGTSSLPVMRYLVTPWLLETVKAAMAGEIDTRTDQKIIPLTGAFKAITEGRIRQLEQEIASLEYRRDWMPKAAWSGQDVQVLVGKQQELESQRKALAAISAPPQVTQR